MPPSEEQEYQEYLEYLDYIETLDAQESPKTQVIQGGGPTLADRAGNALETLIGGLASAGRGATFGLSDEIAGLAVDGGADRVREARDRFARQNPITSTTADIGGSILSGVALTPAKFAKPLLANPLARVLETGAKSAVAGGTAGAARSFGEADQGGRLAAALQGGKQGAILGGAVGGGLAGVGAGVRAAGRLEPVKKLTQSLRERGLGIRGVDVRRGFNRAEELVDEFGNKVDDVDSAFEAIGEIEKKFSLVDDDGFFNRLTTSRPKQIKTEIAKETTRIGKEVGRLVKVADDVQGRVGIQPDFRKAKKYIDLVRESDELIADKLELTLKKAVKRWQDGPQTVKSLIDRKRAASQLSDIFKGTESAEISPQKALARRIYGAFKEASEKNFDVAMSRAGKKSLVGRLKKQNELFGAYRQFDSTVQNAISTSNIEAVAERALDVKGVVGGGLGILSGLQNPLVGTAIGGGAVTRALVRANPIQAAKILENLPKRGDVLQGIAPKLAAALANQN